MDFPSGDHAGLPLRNTDSLRISGVACVPSALEIQMVRSPDRSLSNASRVPSGDHAPGRAQSRRVELAYAAGGPAFPGPWISTAQILISKIGRASCRERG